MPSHNRHASWELQHSFVFFQIYVDSCHLLRIRFYILECGLTEAVPSKVCAPSCLLNMQRECNYTFFVDDKGLVNGAATYLPIFEWCLVCMWPFFFHSILSRWSYAHIQWATVWNSPSPTSTRWPRYLPHFVLPLQAITHKMSGAPRPVKVQQRCSDFVGTLFQWSTDTSFVCSIRLQWFWYRSLSTAKCSFRDSYGCYDILVSRISGLHYVDEKSSWTRRSSTRTILCMFNNILVVLISKLGHYKCSFSGFLWLLLYSLSPLLVSDCWHKPDVQSSETRQSSINSAATPLKFIKAQPTVHASPHTHLWNSSKFN